jgi:predicted Zn-dependent protease
MDRAEAEIRESRFLIRRPEVTGYVGDVACRLLASHCRDVRAYVVRTPLFNASMAPNGMMQVWTGLLLRCRDEAQFAAIVGHEMGHYLRRHGIERWRDVRSKADVSAFLTLGLGAAGLGVVGMMTQLALVASIFAFTRDQEREADVVGLNLVAGAGYPPVAAAEVWEQLIAELEASTAEQSVNVFFATHPAPEERLGSLRALAAGRGDAQGDRGRERYRSRLAAIRPMLLRDEVALRQYGRSEVVLDLLLRDAPDDGLLWFAKGEIYRLRADAGDAERALAAYESALAGLGAPPETHRSIGMVQLRAGRPEAARQAFERYLALKPDASDREAIRALLTR